VNSQRRINSYKDLKFWQNAFRVALLIINMARVLPKDRANDILVKQVIRSAASVGANIAEGFGRYKGKEYERFLKWLLVRLMKQNTGL
jgi:four helix bundle protein